jgi:hypothetical protein
VSGGLLTRRSQRHAADGCRLAAAHNCAHRTQGDGAGRRQDARQCDQKRISRSPTRRTSSRTHREGFDAQDALGICDQGFATMNMRCKKGSHLPQCHCEKMRRIGRRRACSWHSPPRRVRTFAVIRPARAASSFGNGCQPIEIARAHLGRFFQTRLEIIE